jgi:hypothetical protein
MAIGGRGFFFCWDVIIVIREGIRVWEGLGFLVGRAGL